MKGLFANRNGRHPDESRDPVARVCAPKDSYARYRSRWIPTFVGMTMLEGIE